MAKGHAAVQHNPLNTSILMLLLKGLFRSLLASGAFILFIAVVMYVSPLPEWIIPYFVVLGMLFSIIYGSMYVGRNVDEKGWLRGGYTGLLYIAIVIILSYLFNLEPELSISLLSRFFLGFSFGCLGGILGINS